MTMEQIENRMGRINQEIMHHHYRMAQFPSIDGNKQRTLEIEKLKAEFSELKLEHGVLEFQAEFGN
jgi:hypothetical protein